MCAGNELFYVALYLMKWVHTPLSVTLGAGYGILGDLTWPTVIWYICMPIWFLKNAVNFVQLWKASKILVGVDLAERAEARELETQKAKKT